MQLCQNFAFIVCESLTRFSFLEMEVLRQLVPIKKMRN